MCRDWSMDGHGLVEASSRPKRLQKTSPLAGCIQKCMHIHPVAKTPAEGREKTFKVKETSKNAKHLHPAKRADSLSWRPQQQASHSNNGPPRRSPGAAPLDRSVTRRVGLHAARDPRRWRVNRWLEHKADSRNRSKTKKSLQQCSSFVQKRIQRSFLCSILREESESNRSCHCVSVLLPQGGEVYTGYIWILLPSLFFIELWPSEEILRGQHDV